MIPDQIYQRLKNFSVFKKWSDPDLRELARRVEVRQLAPGEVVFQHRDISRTPLSQLGSLSDAAYIVNSGQVRQAAHTRTGVELWHRTLGEGQVFGQVALAHGQTRATTAQALNRCVLFKLNAPDLNWALNRYPAFWKSLLQTDAAGRLRAIPLFRSVEPRAIENHAKTAEYHEFAAGQPIRRPDGAGGTGPGQPDAGLWVIDWGQVEITAQHQLVLSGSGRYQIRPPTAGVVRSQGFNRLPYVLTAGNWFVTGEVHIPNQLTVEARAFTKARLLFIPALQIEQLESHYPDIGRQMRHRLNIEGFLQQALAASFPKLRLEHWQQLATYAGWMHVPAGLDVIRQGEKGSRLLVLTDGGAIVRERDDQGRERPRYFMTPGAVTDIDAMLHGRNYAATVESVTTSADSGHTLNGTDWLCLHREDLRHMTLQQPRLWRHTRLWTHAPRRKKKKRYEWLEDEETVEYAGRRHVITLLPAMALPFAIWIVLVIVLAFLLTDIPLLSIGLPLLVLAILSLPVPIINYLDDYYVITNLRVTHRERVLFFHETRVEAPLARIQDVSIDTRFIGRLIGYGDLSIQTAATIGMIRFRRVPDPQYVQSVLQAQQRLVQASRLAEQRERLRGELVGRLGLTLEHRSPERVLPEGTPLPPRHNWERLQRAWAARWQALLKAWRDLRRRLLELLLLPLPKEARQRALEGGKKKRPKKRQGDEDKVYRKHWIILLRRIWLPLLAFLVYHLLVLAGWRYLGPYWQALQQPMPSAIVVLAVVAWLLFFFALWYRFENWRNDKYILTKEYIIDVEALPFGFREQRRQASWDRIQNAVYDLPSLWANLFDYGTVVVQTAAAEGAFTFENVPHPRQVQQEIFRYLEQHRLAQEDREASQRQKAFSETLQLYDELMRETSWHSRPT